MLSLHTQLICACAGAAFCAGAAAALVCAHARRRDEHIYEVIIFPGELGVSGAGLERLLRRLRAARRSLDVCVLVLSCPQLSAELLAASGRGVRVRVLLDGDMSQCAGSQLQRLRGAGVPVHVAAGPFLMHHKFCVLDERLLVCGSFNWTRQAARGNNEHVIVTDQPALVAPFVHEFNKLWTSTR